MIVSAGQKNDRVYTDRNTVAASINHLVNHLDDRRQSLKPEEVAQYAQAVRDLTIALDTIDRAAGI